jgi:hypothetical protein
MTIQAKFMLLCHGRVGTASLLEGCQRFEEIFVPSYWHTDEIIRRYDLSKLNSLNSRFSEQAAIPRSLENISLGLINHNFPLDFPLAQKICDNSNRILAEDAKIFIWTRNPVDNILSSYKTYITTHLIFELFEGSDRATGIYSAFNTKTRLSLSEFIQKYSYIADYEKQKKLYNKAGFEVHLRPYELLCADFEGELHKILEISNIDFERSSVRQISYPRSDNWPLQVSFAFRNKFMIDDFSLNVGYFDPPREFPNQGTLTLEISENIFVAPDQWFLLPRSYKKRILKLIDPWQVIKRTTEGYKAFERNIQDMIHHEMKQYDEERSRESAAVDLASQSVNLSFR